MAVTKTVDRVPLHTAESVNEAIRREADRRIDFFARHRRKVPERLEELDREWDVERALATGSSCLSLLGLTIGLAGRRRWLLLPVVVQSFFLQHALQGWCPPLPILRRLGFRTPAEIEEERCKLALLTGGADDGRGDLADDEALLEHPRVR